MAEVKTGDRVRVHYKGTLEDGTVFDSSEDRSPLEFTVGKGEMIKGFDQGIVGMNTGESKTIRISSEDAYGPHKQEMVFEFNKNRAPENFDPQIGQQVYMQRADGKMVSVSIIGKTETAFVMDCNHPLAGKNLIFDVTLVEIL